MEDFKVYRDGDARLRLRKWVLEMYDGGELLDRRRIFGGPFFKVRLRRKLKRMVEMKKRVDDAISLKTCG